MSSPTERAAAGGGAAARPDPPADQPPATPDAIVPEPPPGEPEAPLFLRAGRAGLAPEAVTVIDQPGEDAPATLPQSARPDVTGLPPWADDLPGPEPGSPPPWEAGPWPSYEPPAPDRPGDDNGPPGAGASSARRPADPFAGHFADLGPFADHAPFPGPFPSEPDAPGGPNGHPPGAARPEASTTDAASAPQADGGAGDEAPTAGQAADQPPVPGASPVPGAPAAPDGAADAPWAADRDRSLPDWSLNGFTVADTLLDPFPPVGTVQSPGRPAAGPARAADGTPARTAPARTAPARTAPARAVPGPAAPGAPNSLGTAALAAGILGIAVLPGVILGLLGLRRAAITGTGRRQSWLGIALSLVWAAGIIIVAWPGPGPAGDPGCAQYRAGGSAAVARVTAALKPRAAAARLGADLGPAANAVNDATARAQSIGVRNTLAALSGDLQAEQAAVVTGRPAPAALRVTLTADAAAAARLCGASG